MRNLVKCNFIVMHCIYHIVRSTFESARTFSVYIFTNIKGTRLTHKCVLRKTDNYHCYKAILPHFSQEKWTTIKCNIIMLPSTVQYSILGTFTFQCTSVYYISVSICLGLSTNPTEMRNPIMVNWILYTSFI